MRILKSQYRMLRRIVYGLDGTILYGSGETMQSRRPSKSGWEQWNLGEDGQPSDIGSGDIDVWELTPLPAGQTLVAGRLRTGTRQEMVPTILTAHGELVRTLPQCHSHPCAVLSPTGDRIIVQGVETPGGGRMISLRLPIHTEKQEPEWQVLFGLEGDGYLWHLGSVFDNVGERFVSLDRDLSRGRGVTAQWRAADTGQKIGEPITLSVLGGSAALVSGDRLLTTEKNSMFGFALQTPRAKPVRVTSDTGKHFTGIAVHPDGRRVFATCNDATVREYDAVTLQEIKSYAWKVGRLRCVAVAPDGATAAAGSDTGKVVVWDLE